ncbi:DUF4132 domain-containing protein [Streptomyces diastatochromogenes]|nr:DUF4132 domain-containing protein [Streptomyces diastatochromogenes]
MQWLGRLPKKIRNRTVNKSVAKALEAVAARAGLTPSMLRERGVPTLGLDGRGIREIALGAHTAELSVREPGTAALSFRGPEGRLLKSAPKEVREARAEELKEVRAGLRELKALVAAERSRLEEHLAAGTVWPAEDWQRYYADHPVTGTVARALLWELAEGEGWTAGVPERAGGGWALAGHDGTARPVGPGARLRLWHPLRAGGEEVAEWRAAMAEREERQPFKQVFREVYPLTPAELATGSYSNRFAGHVLRYGQARALMTERGWAGNHLGYFSDGQSSELVKELPAPGELPAARGRAGGPGSSWSWPTGRRARTGWRGSAPRTRSGSRGERARRARGAPGRPSRWPTYRPSCSRRRCGTSTCSWGWRRSGRTRTGGTAGSTGRTTATGRAGRSAR